MDDTLVIRIEELRSVFGFPLCLHSTRDARSAFFNSNWTCLVTFHIQNWGLLKLETKCVLASSSTSVQVVLLQTYVPNFIARERGAKNF